MDFNFLLKIIKKNLVKNNALLEDVHCYAMKNDRHTNNLVAMVNFNGDKTIQKILFLLKIP